MTLDERVRGGLHRSAETGRRDDDEAFANVELSFRRVEARTRVLRQATVVVVVVTLLAGVGVFISWRAAPERYRTTATVEVAPASPDPIALAMAPATRRNTLVAAQFAPDDTRIRFRATRSGTGRIALAVTAPSTDEAQRILAKWVAVLARTRLTDARDRIIAERKAHALRIKRLHQELRRVDTKLAKLMPGVYGDVLRHDTLNSVLPGRVDAHVPLSPPPPPVPERGSVEALNLAFLRIQLIEQIAAEEKALLEPRSATEILDQAPTTRIDETPTATWIALSGWFVALVLVLIGAITIYRRSRFT